MRLSILAAALAATTCSLTTAVIAADVPEVMSDPATSLGFYFNLAPVLMNRSTPEALNLVEDFSGSPYLTGHQFDFGWDTGIDATVGVQIDPDNAFDLRALYVDSTAGASFATGGFIGLGFVGPSANFDVGYETVLKSLEGSWNRKLTDHVTLLAGLRAMSIDDTLDSYINDTVGRALYAYHNQLLGVQIGADVTLTDPDSALQVNVIGKVGAFRQQSQGGVQLFQPSDTLAYDLQSDVISSSALSAEVGVQASYRLTDNLSVVGGYQILALNNTALASDNAAMSIYDPTLLEDNMVGNSLVYQGVKLGLAGHF
jgi:hypothetical protein